MVLTSDKHEMLINLILSLNCVSPLWGVIRIPSKKEQDSGKTTDALIVCFFKENPFIFTNPCKLTGKENEQKEPCKMCAAAYR